MNARRERQLISLSVVLFIYVYVQYASVKNQFSIFSEFFLVTGATHNVAVDRTKAILPPKRIHNPRVFSDPKNLRPGLRRGPNIIGGLSGCRIAAWVFPTPDEIQQGDRFDDCWFARSTRRKFLYNVSDMQAGDTVYVNFRDLGHFVANLLNDIQVDFVLITGQIQKGYVPNSTEVSGILESPHVLQWFCQNIPIYVRSNPTHPKVAPFPYGLREKVVNTTIWLTDDYRQLYLDNIFRPPNKTRFIFAGYLRRDNESAPSRNDIPGSSVKQPKHVYYADLVRSTYVISPDGDRPECYRHYEGIGFGTAPITELDPILFRHLSEGGTQFATKNWSLVALKKQLPRNPNVNRNMVLEEYWMEYVERTVGQPLRWWDRVSEDRVMLVNLTMPLKTNWTRQRPITNWRSGSKGKAMKQRPFDAIRKKQKPLMKRRPNGAVRKKGPPKTNYQTRPTGHVGTTELTGKANRKGEGPVTKVSNGTTTHEGPLTTNARNGTLTILDAR